MNKQFIFRTSIILIFSLIATTGQAMHRALQADGAENYVVIGPVPELDMPGASIECWVKLITLPKKDRAYLVWNGDGQASNDRYIIAVDTKGKVVAEGNFKGGFKFQSKNAIQLNQWVYLALTIDDKAKKVKLYINGELDSERSYSNMLPVAYSWLTLGAGFDGNNLGGKPYLGWLDEVRIFDSPRKPADIKTTMHTALIGNEPGLIGYWRFDEPENEFTASDSSPNDNHGTLFGDEAFIESDLPLSYLRGEINTADGWQVVIANQPAKLLLTLTIIGTPDSPAITSIGITLPEELSKGARLEGAITCDGTMVPTTSFQSERVLTIQLDEGIPTGQIEIPFVVAEAGQTEAEGLTFAVTLKGNTAEDVPAGDANGNPDDSNSFSGIALISGVPVPLVHNVEVTPVPGENDLHLSWAPVEDGRVRKYDIYANDEKIAEITGQKKANYVHRSLTPGAELSYSVQAVAANVLKSPPSELVTATVGTDTIPPPAPIVKVERLQPTLIRVSWTPPTPDVARYDIARAASDEAVTQAPPQWAGTQALPLQELTADETEYLDDTPRAYRYVVRAWDEQDNQGDWSQLASLRVSEAPATQAAARTSLWAVLGPFDQGKAPALETLAAPMGPYTGKGGQNTTWFELPLDEYEEEAFEIDWETVLKAGDSSEAYAITYLDSPKPQLTKFAIHQKSGSQTRLWLNGMLLKQTPGSSECLAKLRPGRNKLFVYLSHDEGAWRGVVRILNPEGRLLRELTSISPFDVPFQPSIPVTQPRPWGPEQATGPPNTMQDGDISTAYGSASPDEGLLWLYLTYDKPMHARQVRIRETCNPGSVAKVELYDEEKGSPHPVWEGMDPTNKSPGVFDVVFPQTEYRVVGVKITLDTNRVRGFNEIDAVQLVGAEGTQWATGAIASSIWGAQRYSQPQVNTLSVAELVEHLKLDGTPDIRRQSAQRLISQLKDAAVPLLKDALSDPDASVRITVIQALTKLKSEAAVDILLAHLKNPAQYFSEDELKVMFDGLCHLEHTKAIEPLLTWAARTKLPTDNIATRYVAIALYEGAGEWEAADALIRVVRGLNPRTTHLFEAEDYEQVTDPFQIFDAPHTWGGKYLSVPDTLDRSGDEIGEAQYKFVIPKEGEYMVIARVMASHRHADSFSISIDEGEPHRWDIKPQVPRWVWNAPTVQPDGRGGILLFHLEAGEHTLKIGNQEDGAKIDRLVIQRLPLDIPALAELVDAENPRLRREAMRLLVYLKDERAVIPLRTTLKDDDANVRLTALRSLATLRDIDGLLETLNHDDAQMRREAVRALKHLGDARTVQALCDKLKDTDKEVRKEARLALESLRDERAIESLMEHLETAENETESIAAAYVLGAFGKPQAMEVVAPLLYRPNATAPIAHVLGELHHRGAVEVLVEFLNDGSANVRFEVAEALGRLRATEAVDDVRNLMENDPVKYVQLGAADALYCLGEADGLETLRGAGALIGTDWHLLGPFDGMDKNGIDRIFPPEREIDLTATYSGRLGQVHWQKLKEREMGAFIDPRMFLASGNNDVVYGLTAVDVPTARPAEIRTRNDDEAKVWLNNILVSSHKHHAHEQPKQIRVQLKQGENVILVKLRNSTGPSYFQVFLTDDKGKGFPDVSYAAPISSPLVFQRPPPSEGEVVRGLNPRTTAVELRLPTVESPDYHLNIHAMGMPTLTALAIAPDGMLYAASKDAGRIYQIRPDTSWREFAEVPYPTDLACSSDGMLYVTSGRGKQRGVFYLSATGKKKLIADGFAVPDAIEMAPDGTLFVADSFAGRIDVVTNDGKVIPRVDGLASPAGPTCLAFAPSGELYFIEGETDRLFRLKKGGKPTAIDWDAVEAANIAFDTKGNLFATVPSTGRLLVRNSDGQLAVVVRGLSQPSGIAIDPTGTIFVTNKSQILKLTR